MKEMTPFRKKSERLRSSLLCSIENFRKCNDNIGLDNFLNSIYDLEELLEYQQYSGELRVKTDEVLPVLKILSEYIKNQDIIGITDILEFELYPLVEELIER